jgi:hypothetical protein
MTKTWQIGSEQFSFKMAYDSYGRLERLTYPNSAGTDFTVRYASVHMDH